MRYAEALGVLRETALAQMTAVKAADQTELVSLTAARGRVCAKDILSQVDLPPFTNSAIDGFALTKDALAKGSMKVAGALYPGETPKSETPSGSVWEIMTGAPVPLDAVACVKIEDTKVDREKGIVDFQPEAQLNDFFRLAGSDFAKGDLVLKAGDTIRPENQMALASTGSSTVEVKKKMRVLLIATGKELVEPGRELKPGQIYNSTQVYLAEALKDFGCDVELGPTIADEPEVFARVLAKMDHDLLVTTGAVSMGQADFIPGELKAAGFNILFHRLDIKPGRPLLFGTRGTTSVFGLPGNPVSGVVGLRFFIEAYLRTRLGRAPEQPLKLKLKSGYRKPKNLRAFLKAHLVSEAGDLRVEISNGQPSHMIQSLTKSSVWAVLPEDSDSFEPESLVDVYFQNSGSLNL